jgi:hypothetical protein
MNANKMLVVLLTKTNAVLGVATRRAAGAPPVADLVGAALLARMTDQEVSVAVPADELSIKEVDYSNDVVRQPRAHVVDASGTVVTPPVSVTGIGNSNLEVTVTISANPPADKTVLVVIDGGPNHPPLKFVGKTALNVATTHVPISGVPPGAHVVLASVDGYSSRLEVKNFA